MNFIPKYFVSLQQVSANRRDTTLLRQNNEMSLSGGAGMTFVGKSITTIAVIRMI